VVCAVTDAKGVSGSGESMAAIAVSCGVSAACSLEMRRVRAGGTATEGGQEAAKMRRRVKKLSCAACRKAVPDVLETPSRWGASIHAALVYKLQAGALTERTTEVRRCYPLELLIVLLRCSLCLAIDPPWR
jgi:hypothetical protein